MSTANLSKTSGVITSLKAFQDCLKLLQISCDASETSPPLGVAQALRFAYRNKVITTATEKRSDVQGRQFFIQNILSSVPVYCGLKFWRVFCRWSKITQEQNLSSKKIDRTQAARGQGKRTTRGWVPSWGATLPLVVHPGWARPQSGVASQLGAPLTGSSMPF